MNFCHLHHPWAQAQHKHWKCEHYFRARIIPPCHAAHFDWAVFPSSHCDADQPRALIGQESPFRAVIGQHRAISGPICVVVAGDVSYLGPDLPDTGDTSLPPPLTPSLIDLYSPSHSRGPGSRCSANIGIVLWDETLANSTQTSSDLSCTGLVWPGSPAALTGNKKFMTKTVGEESHATGEHDTWPHMWPTGHRWGRGLSPGLQAVTPRTWPGLVKSVELWHTWSLWCWSGPGSDCSDPSWHNILQPPGSGSWEITSTAPAPGVFYVMSPPPPSPAFWPQHWFTFNCSGTGEFLIISSSPSFCGTLCPFFLVASGIVGDWCRWSHLGSL